MQDNNEIRTGSITYCPCGILIVYDLNHIDLLGVAMIIRSRMDAHNLIGAKGVTDPISGVFLLF